MTALCFIRNIGHTSHLRAKVRACKGKWASPAFAVSSCCGGLFKHRVPR